MAEINAEAVFAHGELNLMTPCGREMEPDLAGRPTMLAAVRCLLAQVQPFLPSRHCRRRPDFCQSPACMDPLSRRATRLRKHHGEGDKGELARGAKEIFATDWRVVVGLAGIRERPGN